DPARIVTGVEALDAAGPEHISFLIDPRYAAAAAASRAGAFLTGHDAGGLPAPLLRTAKPRQALIRLLTLFHPPTPATAGIDPTAVVAADARVDPTAAVGPLAVVESGAVLGPRVRVHAFAFVGARAEVGEDSVLHPRVVLCAGVKLGRRVVVHPGAVIGADGFGYAFDGEAHRKLAQSGLARDVAPGEKVFGTPARPVLQAKRLFTLEEQLPEILRRLRKAEQRLQRLESRLGLAEPDETTSDDAR